MAAGPSADHSSRALQARALQAYVPRLAIEWLRGQPD